MASEMLPLIIGEISNWQQAHHKFRFTVIPQFTGSLLYECFDLQVKKT